VLLIIIVTAVTAFYRRLRVYQSFNQQRVDALKDRQTVITENLYSPHNGNKTK